MSESGKRGPYKAKRYTEANMRKEREKNDGTDRESARQNEKECNSCLSHA